MELKKLYQKLPKGQENAISREQLSELFNTSDRIARQTIEQMIYHDMPVCNLRHGYFKPVNVDELKAYSNINGAYLKKFLKRQYRLNKAIEQFNQLGMEL